VSNPDTDNVPESRERALAVMIRSAQQNPGVFDVMKVYDRVQEVFLRTYPYLGAEARVVRSVSDRTSAA